LRKPIRVTYETVRQIGLGLPHVEEGTSYGTPALKVKGKLFVRLREDNETIVIRVPFEQRAEMLAADPETYYITDHYAPYEYMLVRLSKVHPDALRDLIALSHRVGQASRPVQPRPGGRRRR
jgi:hypothetical protein